MSRFMRIAEVKKEAGLSRSTIYRRMSEGTFPKQVPLGENSVGWREIEVNGWKEERVKSRDARCA